MYNALTRVTIIWIIPSSAKPFLEKLNHHFSKTLEICSIVSKVKKIADFTTLSGNKPSWCKSDLTPIHF